MKIENDKKIEEERIPGEEKVKKIEIKQENIPEVEEIIIESS